MKIIGVNYMGKKTVIKLEGGKTLAMAHAAWEQFLSGYSGVDICDYSFATDGCTLWEID